MKQHWRSKEKQKEVEDSFVKYHCKALLSELSATYIRINALFDKSKKCSKAQAEYKKLIERKKEIEASIENFKLINGIGGNNG